MSRLDEELDSLKVYVIIDLEGSWLGANLLFWKPERKGYTDDLERAGSYSRKEVDSICTDGDCLAVLRWDLERSDAKRSVIDRCKFGLKEIFEKAKGEAVVSSSMFKGASDANDTN